ncbi:hypothetical protein B0H16DRAFT_1479057 [Mycena metata]|uniref:Uncharacterized protein n=1 Tax=Mycena metata TaxID=1033252 RepID=A0AAD7H5Z8_9AGAR|nr:hypothetical protein B0H16DRAFT_1479057 [Mycena metata]
MVPTTEPFLVLIRSQLHALPFSHKVQKGDEVCTKAQARVERVVSAVSHIGNWLLSVELVPTTEPFLFERDAALTNQDLGPSRTSSFCCNVSNNPELLGAEMVPTTEPFLFERDAALTNQGLGPSRTSSFCCNVSNNPELLGAEMVPTTEPFLFERDAALTNQGLGPSRTSSFCCNVSNNPELLGAEMVPTTEPFLLRTSIKAQARVERAVTATYPNTSLLLGAEMVPTTEAFLVLRSPRKKRTETSYKAYAYEPFLALRFGLIDAAILGIEL